MTERAPASISGSPSPIAGRCGSPLSKKNRGRFCTRYPCKSKTRCKFHGGRSLSGIAHPNFKHGMYSTVLPTNLGKLYEITRQNPALVALTEQIALVDARVFELFEQLSSGDGPMAWARALKAATACEQAMQAVRVAVADRTPARGQRMADALKQLDGAVTENVAVTRKGATDAETWPLITEQIYLRKKLVDSEVRRRKDAHEMVTRERVLALLGSIAASVARHVPDPKAKQAVVEDMRRLVSGEPSV